MHKFPTNILCRLTTQFLDHLTPTPLQLFKTILDYPWFRSSSIILFLNKKDLFEEKIPRSHIGDYFSGYKGERGDADFALRFMSEMFQDIFSESCRADEGRTLFLHLTCATDTENIKRVFQNVKSTILQKNINELNLG